MDKFVCLRDDNGILQRPGIMISTIPFHSDYSYMALKNSEFYGLPWGGYRVMCGNIFEKYIDS